MKKLLAIFISFGIAGHAGFCFAAAPYQKIYLKSGETIEGWIDTAPDGSVKIRERMNRQIRSYPRTDIVRIENYDARGNLFKEYNYENGLKQGKYKIYNAGSLEYEGSYKDDQLEGVQRHYDGNGQVRWEKTYRDGKLIRRKE